MGHHVSHLCVRADRHREHLLQLIVPLLLGADHPRQLLVRLAPQRRNLALELTEQRADVRDRRLGPLLGERLRGARE